MAIAHPPWPRPGDRFGHWTVIAPVVGAGARRPVKVRCTCGTQTQVQFQVLRLGRSTKCKKCGGKYPRGPKTAVCPVCEEVHPVRVCPWLQPLKRTVY